MIIQIYKRHIRGIGIIDQRPKVTICHQVCIPEARGRALGRTSFVGIPMNIALLFLRRLMPGMGLGIGGRPMLPVYPLAALPDEFGEADAGRKEGRKAALLVTCKHSKQGQSKNDEHFSDSCMSVFNVMPSAIECCAQLSL
eukprot:373700-Pelagomonas_calceolata.AAC.2